jgi:hypothetical protein
MGWRGFTVESKDFCGYPACGRWHFWRGYPMAFVRFYWLTLRDTVLIFAARHVGWSRH